MTYICLTLSHRKFLVNLFKFYTQKNIVPILFFLINSTDLPHIEMKVTDNNSFIDL